MVKDMLLFFANILFFVAMVVLALNMIVFAYQVKNKQKETKNIET